MENNNKKETFEYTYSSKQQEEIESIRKKYLPKQEDKMEQIRKLDQMVTRPGTILGLLFGIVGCLIFGVGMCCVLVWGDILFLPGIVVGILGMCMMGIAYPVYQKVTKIQKEKIGPQILALTEELM